jgi:hypothetical protein
MNVELTDLFVRLPAFAGAGGAFMISNLNIRKMTSLAEVIVFSFQNGDGGFLMNSNLSELSSESPLAAAFSMTNCSEAGLEHVILTQSAVCGAIYENTTVTMVSTNFSQNECIVQGNNIPLAMVTASMCESFLVIDSVFRENTAMSGSLFIMNASGIIRNVTFANNTAVQGAGVFANDVDILLERGVFIGNKAMTVGGAVSVAEGNATFRSCDFVDNTAGEGPAIHGKNMKELVVVGGYGKNNNATTGTFVFVKGSPLKLVVKDVEVDDEFGKAIAADDLSFGDFRGSRFDCRKACTFAGEMRRKREMRHVMPKAEKRLDYEMEEDMDEEEEEKEEGKKKRSMLHGLWLMVPVCCVVGIFLWRLMGRRGVGRIRKRLRRKRNQYTV